MRKSTSEVMIRFVCCLEWDDDGTCRESFFVGRIGRREEVVVVDFGQWFFGRLQVFSFLVQMAFCRVDALGYKLGQG